MCFWKKSSSFERMLDLRHGLVFFHSAFHPEGVGSCVHRWWGRMQWYLPWELEPAPPHHKPVLWPDPGGLHLWVSARPHWVPGCCADSVVPSWQEGRLQGIWSWCFQAFPCSGTLYQEVVYLQRTLNTWRKFLGQQEKPTYHHAFRGSFKLQAGLLESHKLSQASQNTMAISVSQLLPLLSEFFAL